MSARDVASSQVCRGQCNGQAKRGRYSIETKSKGLPLNIDWPRLATFREVVANKLPDIVQRVTLVHRNGRSYVGMLLSVDSRVEFFAFKQWLYTLTS